MFIAAVRAIGDLASPEFRGILARSFGLTILLYALVLGGFYLAMQSLTLVRWPWADRIIDIAAWLGLAVALFLLMAPVTALFAGVFLDRVAAIVERHTYPMDPPGKALPGLAAAAIALSFGLVVLAVNIAILPTLFFGVGVFAIIAANAYLLSREYFEMAAMRHVAVAEAKALRRRHRLRVFVAGLIPAGLAAVPFLGVAVPLFATSYFVHFYKGLKSSSP